MIFYFVVKNYNNCANLPYMSAEKEKNLGQIKDLLKY